jgi:hypothetical protein
VTGAQLLIGCLEREGVRYVFRVPGEETLVNDAHLDSSVRFVSVRHEQAAAFMASLLAVPWLRVLEADHFSPTRWTDLAAACHDATIWALA